MTVSVCIVTYNSASDINECLDAVNNQSYPVATIVVIDNASTDSSVEQVRKFVSRHASITLIENNVNIGFAGGQNQAIAATNTDYVLVLNPDVVLHADYIRELVNRLEQDSRAGSATGLLVLKADPSIVDSSGLQMGNNRHVIDRGTGESVEHWLKPGEVFGPSGAAALYRRRMIEDIKLEGEFFDERFFAYKEDVDVAWRARLLGWSSYYVPSAKADHARGWQKGGRRNISLFVRQHSYMNQLYMLVKNEQLSLHLFKVLPILVAREAAKLVYMLIRERDLLKSWKTIIRTLPEMVRKRKALNEKINKLNTN